jgi:pimeloyl-ACP methyl ester carboxylesterase
MAKQEYLTYIHHNFRRCNLKRYLIMTTILLVLTLMTSSEVQAQDTLPFFEQSDCLIDVPSESDIECGTLITLEDYDDPGGRTVRLPVIINHSRNANRSKEALLFTEGGPGYSSLGSVRWLAHGELGDTRDVIILEQRGNKFAQPSLDCDFSILWDEKPGETPCLDSLLQSGIALEHFTASYIAADINALKKVLNYDAWSLYGTSYSTRLMQLVMLQYPEKIRAVVLHSVSPITDNRYLHDPEHTARALHVMFDDCDADPDCSQAYPDLENKFYNLVRKLNAEPVEFEMTLPNSTTRFTYEVNGEALIGFMDGIAFYGPAYPVFETAYLPLLIEKVSQGNTGVLYPWVKGMISRWGEDAFAWGLYFAANCQDDAPGVTPEMVDAQIAAFPGLDGYYRHRDELSICAVWDLEPSTSLPDEPIASNIPTLILAGRYDPITPPEWSQTALTNLEHATFVEFPSSGHSVNTDNPCAQRITAAFLDNPGAEVDLSCVETAPEPGFVLPDEIIIAPAVYEIHYGELGYSVAEENLFLLSWLTLIGTGLVALGAIVIKLIRRRKQISSDISMCAAAPLLILLATVVLFWGYALRFTLQSVAATASNTLRFGLPDENWWLFAIVLLIGLMTIALIALTMIAWIRNYWTLLGRVAISVTGFAAIIFCAILANWGLFTPLFR